MGSIVGKWAGGEDGHIIYEFFDNREFRISTTADPTRTIYGQYFATFNTVKFETGNNSNVCRYEVSEDVLVLYPPDGGSPILFRRVAPPKTDALDARYKQLITAMQKARTKNEYFDIAKQFWCMNGYKNSNELAQECFNRYNNLTN